MPTAEPSGVGMDDAGGAASVEGEDGAAMAAALQSGGKPPRGARSTRGRKVRQSLVASMLDARLCDATLL